MLFKKKLMPDLPIYHEADGNVFPDLTFHKIPSVANEIANVLAKANLDLRNSTAALSDVLGWLAFQVQALLLLQNKPDEEQRQILDRASNLVEKITDTTTEEIPLVVTTALLLALRLQDQRLGEQAKLVRGNR
jgi:hypothetical protein